VKLIDFGIAKARNRLTETAAQDTVKGKLKYMAPEQALSGPVDRRCDLFALGVVLWEALAGRELFRGNQELAGFRERMLGTAIQPPSATNPMVAPALDALVAKLLAFRAADRCESADELRHALGELVPAAHAIDATDLAALVAATTGMPQALPIQPTTTTDVDTRPKPASPRRTHWRWVAVLVAAMVTAGWLLVTCHK